MPSRTSKVSVSLDRDLIEQAKTRSVELGLSRFPNLSAYLNHLVRDDLHNHSDSGKTKKRERVKFRGRPEEQ